MRKSKTKKQSKSAEKKNNQFKKQINLLLFKNSEFQSVQRPRSVLMKDNEQPRPKRHSIGLIMGSKKVSLSSFLDQNITSGVKLSKGNFIIHNIIGKGGFGKVYKVQDKATKQLYAMKQMEKALILSKRSLQSIRNQRQLLVQINNPFLVNMKAAFQDNQYIYLLLDLMSGGDLRYYIFRKHHFTEEETRFFIACLVQGIEYLHRNNIIHRDIKPQNLVIDSKGYMHITDLGIARLARTQNSSDTSGTPSYMAPEVLNKQCHSFEADYYAIGVILYQMMFQRRPYLGKKRKQICEEIMSKQISIKKSQIPDGWSVESADFANKLLQRRAITRLGWGGIRQIKQHIWLKNFPWQDLASKKLQSPFIKYINYKAEQIRFQPTHYEKTFMERLQQNRIMLRKSTTQDLFQGYSYIQQDKLVEYQTTSSQLYRKIDKHQ